MTTGDAFATVRSAPMGAQFVRADLHIHSFGPKGSPDVDDCAMTPAGILTRALALGIRVVAITDHNTIDNVQEAVSAASGLEVLVVPGVELASPGGHILVYAKDVERLQQLLAKLSFDEQRTACRTSIPDILRATSEVAGFAIAAHVDLANGLENAIPGYGDPKAAVITDRALYAIEVANPEALAYYSDEDDDARKELLHRRLDVLADPFCRILPKVVFSDAHTDPPPVNGPLLKLV